MEVIHEGILEISIKPDSRSAKDWKPRLFVLKHYSASGRSSLDYYKNTSKRWQKQSIKGVISLWPNFEISIAHLCSYKFTLKLATAEHTVYLAASNATGMNKWYYFIQTQVKLNPTQDMYIFNVQAQDSEAMNLIGAVGDCQLVITPDFEVQVALLPRKEIVCIWPFDSLKTFSYGGGLFSFTSGRHAPHGSGDFSFVTSSDRVIHDTLHKLIDRARRNSTSSAGSSIRSMSERPPAKLPQSESSSDSPSSNEGEEQLRNLHQGNPRKDNVYIAPNEGTPPPLPNQPPPKIPPKSASAVKSWLHERYGVGAEPEKHTTSKSPSPLEDDPEGGDHMYSKTVHFSLKKTLPPRGEDDPTIYNSLVHRGLARAHSKDYDIAYPDSKPHGVVNGEMYSVISEEKESVGSKKVTSTPPIPDGMTANPLYGSSGNLLEAINNNSSPPKDDPSPFATAIVEETPPKPRPDVTANPVYVTSNIRSGSPVRTETTPIDTPGSNVCRYTTINKSEGQGEGQGEGQVPSSVESDAPPPIPQRLYSESDQSSVS